LLRRQETSGRGDGVYYSQTAFVAAESLAVKLLTTK